MPIRIKEMPCKSSPISFGVPWMVIVPQ